MPRYNETWKPEVLPQEHFWEYLIESESNPGEHYKVDLRDFDGNGSCTCDDYKFRIHPIRDAEVEPIHKRCKHIQIAYECLGYDFMQKWIDNVKSGKKMGI